MENNKTATDEQFELYLQQRGIKAFEYEPYGSQDKNPDYLVKTKNAKILVEVKELEKLPLDRAAQGDLKTLKTFTLDPRVEYDILRRRIDSASKQLKPHSANVDYTIIILGKKDGFDISIDTLFYAMFGDPY